MQSKTADTEPPQASNGHHSNGHASAAPDEAAPLDIREEAISLALHYEPARATILTLDSKAFPDSAPREIFEAAQHVFSFPDPFSISEVEKNLRTPDAIKLLQTRFAKEHGEAKPGSRAGTVARLLKKPLQSDDATPETTAEARGPYALNEIGNGKRFADANRGRYLFDYPASRWRVYVGGVWRHTDGDDVERAAKAIESQICDEARAETDDDFRSKLYKYAATATKRKTRETMLKDAASEVGMSAPPENFDAQLHLFNVENGTLDLRTGALNPHTATDLLTKCAGTKFEPHATAPTWTRALETWMPDAATRDYLQECAGLSLSGEVRDEFFNFLFGGGDNGKSTFLSTLEVVSGDYFHHAKAEIFMRPKFAQHGEAAQPAMLSLQGARLLTVSEIESEHEMSAALVKGLTGRDPITARGNYDKRPTTFRPQFTLWMFGNEKPKITDASEGMWRRVRLIEFNQTIPRADRDPDFAEKLKAERPGVLNWALEGLKRVQERGLIVPDAVKVATASYRAEQDALSGFLDEICEQSPTAFVKSIVLWEAWKCYCAEQDEPEGTQTAFGIALKKRNWKDARAMIDGRQTRVWKGIRLKN